MGERFLLVTQNVDGLHRRAGSERLIEIHGRLLGTRCSRCSRPETPDETCLPRGHGARDATAAAARSGRRWCGSARRWTRRTSRRWTTSSSAGAEGGWCSSPQGPRERCGRRPGSWTWRRARGAETWLVNAERADNAGRFDHVREGPSGTLLPALLGV